MEVASALDIALEGHQAKSTKLIWKPSNTVPVSGETADKLMNLLDLLDELDDVQSLYDNSELSAEEMERLAG
ncbi:MAG: putative transcriptional regulatory protein YebC [Hyphomonas sp. TMED17]|nr:MAG: putative transcriptional regulatory protein YebC [Hyphomonas sp. TMED17]